ncbi:condensation domain-containing protein [Nocardia sp. BMG51109]|uniref:condensation domain-containing protein n=1 Tax=Nocardia sp. BMG51109 TaxID=1056816 RepID=UPI0004674A28|nr:condensation domain-containing protein [Nocardia sp. BMG51109]
MHLLFLDQLALPPGILLEWSVGAEPGPAPGPIPPTANQCIHLAGGRPTTWLAAAFDVPGPIDEAALQAAFGAWLPRHDALHCSFSAPGPGGSPILNLVSDSDLRITARPPVLAATDHALRELLGARLDAACEPFSFPPYFLGAVSRAENSTVICGFDHAVCDAWSIALAVTELDRLYRTAREDGSGTVAEAAGELPEAGSFLSYCTREAAVPAAITDPLVPAWRDFLRTTGNDLPHFPIDLGVPDGTLAPPAADVRTLLGAGGIAVLHRAARAAGHSTFPVLLAAVAQAVAKLGGRDHTDLVFPVHIRREPRNHNTFGWLVANAPARIPVEGDLAAAVPGAAAAVRAGRRLARVPATRVLDAAQGQLRGARHGLFSVSYADYRQLPGGSRGDTVLPLPRNAIQISRATPVDDVQLWFTRTDDGLALRTRFPGTAVARNVVGEFLDVLGDLVHAAARP